MTHSARPAPTRPRWRGTTVGALAAVAVIALGLGVAPAAVAAQPSPTTLTLQISGAAPAELDLAGVHFELVGPGAAASTVVCVTDVTGSCALDVVPDAASGDGRTKGTGIVLPAGTYAVRQLTAPTGLLPADVIAPLELCVAPAAEGCESRRTIVNVSTYRTRTEIQVVSANGPVALTAVTLTGSGFPAAQVTTDEDGRAAWRGWFLPGEWSFTVAGRAAPLRMTMTPEGGDTSMPWRVDITLPPVEQPPATGPAPAAAPPALAPSPTPAQPASVPAASTARAAVAPPPPPLVVPVDGPPDVVAPAPAPTAPPAPVTPGTGQVFVATDRPTLETAGSVQLLSAGLGILVVALVLTGYGVLRSRRRRRPA